MVLEWDLLVKVLGILWVPHNGFNILRFENLLTGLNLAQQASIHYQPQSEWAAQDSNPHYLKHK